MSAGIHWSAPPRLLAVHWWSSRCGSLPCAARPCPWSAALRHRCVPRVEGRGGNTPPGRQKCSLFFRGSRRLCRGGRGSGGDGARGSQGRRVKVPGVGAEAGWANAAETPQLGITQQTLRCAAAPLLGTACLSKLPKKTQCRFQGTVIHFGV